MRWRQPGAGQQLQARRGGDEEVVRGGGIELVRGSTS